MFYSPHQLYRKVMRVERDEYNRPYANSERWEFVCDCRCDSDNLTEFREDDGNFYRPQYHIVCPRDANVKANDDIRVMAGGDIRGEGKVYNVRHLNILDYTDVWV